MAPRNEVGPQDTTPEGTDTTTTPANAKGTSGHLDAKPAAGRRMCWRMSSQQVCWWAVHEYVAAVLARVQEWPTVGTPAWCLLPDDDPAKLAAVFDAARHWALELETNQQARADASRAVSGAVDWPTLMRKITVRNDFYAAKPWLKRVTS